MPVLLGFEIGTKGEIFDIIFSVFCKNKDSFYALKVDKFGECNYKLKYFLKF